MNYRWMPFLMLAFLLFTNRWVSWEGGLALSAAGDVKAAYLPIAEAAPEFTSVRMPPHQAQRFALPFLVGWMARITSIQISNLFWVAVFGMQLGLLCLAWAAFRKAGAGPNRRLLAFGLLVLQPYFLRYYWLVPGMAVDVLFELGTAGLAASLMSGRMLGIVLATLGRQTSLMLFPGALLYILAGDGWKGRRKGKKVFSAVWAMAAFGLVFLLTRNFGAHFSDGEISAATMYGLFPWLLREGSITAFLEHSLRCVLPLLPVLGLLALERPRSWRADTWSFFLLGAAVAAQPFLAGPVITGQNAARLSTMALFPLVLAWASASRQEWSGRSLSAVLLALLAGSFHHIYTIVGPWNAGLTAALQLAVTAIVFGVGLNERRLKP